MELLGLSPTNQLKLLSNLLDLFYPPVCVYCCADGIWCCESCINKIDFHVDSPKIEGIDRVYVVSSYANPVLRKLLTLYKYSSALCLESALILLLDRWYKGSVLSQERVDAIVPTPTDFRHIEERGFDHAVRLSLVMQRYFTSAPVLTILQRMRRIDAHAEIDDRQARLGNVSGAFSALQACPNRVLLIDDVTTSGATLKESARVLRARGATYVIAFIFANSG